MPDGFALKLAQAALALFASAGAASGAFYMDCAACHPVSANGMSLIGFQTLTNLGPGRVKILTIAVGQTAARLRLVS